MNNAYLALAQRVRWAAYHGEQAIVFLFTPSFAAMIENDTSLIDDVIKNLTRQVLTEHSKAAMINVVTACVDGLSPSKYGLHHAMRESRMVCTDHYNAFPSLHDVTTDIRFKGPEMLSYVRNRRQSEGFSILHGPVRDGCNRWVSEAQDSVPKGTASPSMQYSITFRNHSDHLPRITLPLANTLFKTGQPSMLKVSRYENDKRNDKFVCLKSSERTNVGISIYRIKKNRLPRIYIPAIPLTPARQIKNGLGNIVRTLDFGDGIEEVGPASQELEPAVTDFLEAFKMKQSSINVWALVLPASADPNNQRTSLLMDWASVKARWRDNSNTGDFDYVGNWVAKGATFCRVCKYPFAPPHVTVLTRPSEWRWWVGS